MQLGPPRVNISDPKLHLFYSYETLVSSNCCVVESAASETTLWTADGPGQNSTRASFMTHTCWVIAVSMESKICLSWVSGLSILIIHCKNLTTLHVLFHALKSKSKSCSAENCVIPINLGLSVKTTVTLEA